MNRIVVVGGGPVGLAFAICAAQLIRNAEIIVLERAPEATRSIGEAAGQVFDHRVYALSPQSVALLENSGVWSRLPSARITSVEEMCVSSDADAADVVVDVAEFATHRLPSIHFSRGMALAHIVEHR
ncbi:MAG: NAD-binding protein, partial [Aeromicrobium sp.]|nr:NAD-binding protein [Burkholderiales bacterium]